MTWSEWILVGLLVTALAVAALGGSLPFLIPPGVVLVATAYFSIPVASAALDGLEAARSDPSTGAQGSARRRFWDVVRPRAFRWLWIWLVFYLLLESMLLFVAGGMHLVLSLPSAGIVSLMVPSGLWALAWTGSRGAIAAICLAVPTVGGGLLWGVIYQVMDRLDLGGYMDIGLLVLPPMVAGVTLVAFGVRVGVQVLRRDESWYQQLSSSSEGAGE
jgi:hypothetical protein